MMMSPIYLVDLNEESTMQLKKTFQGETPSKLKVGIDSYCFHRLFGEVYPHQYKTEPPFTMEDFLNFAKRVDVDGGSLESCFFPEFSIDYLVQVKAKLEESNFDRVYALGHPDGLEDSKDEIGFDSIRF